MMKVELGYYLDMDSGDIFPKPINTGKGSRIPIYGLRAVPQEIVDRQWGNPNFGKQNWQVEIFKFGDYIWINQSRHLVFLH